MRRLAALVALLAAPVAADQVFLKGGGQLTGVIVDRTPTSIAIEVAPGRVTVPMSRVERVVEGTSALAAYRDRASRLASDDLAGWLSLAQWAQERDLQTQAREALAHVLALDPDNAAAHRAVGHVLFNGQWLTLADSYRARGFVQFDGAWVTPEEREARIHQQAAEAAAVEAAARAREAEARARQAEAEARRAETPPEQPYASEGFPYPWVFWGGGCLHGCGHAGMRPSPRPPAAMATPPPVPMPTPFPTPRPPRGQGPGHGTLPAGPQS
jgi:hypothetical protein